MLGFIVGTVCLVGLVHTLRRRWHGDCLGGPGHGRGYGSRRGFGARRSAVRGFLERLETTPGQEKAIIAALDELEGDGALLRAESRQTRADLARAVSIGMVDDAALEETFARHDRLLAPLRVSFVEALRKITEVLDDRQRKQLAKLLESGRGYGRPRWAYRDGGAMHDNFGIWA